MLRHQFGQNLILRLDLLLQVRDSFLFGLTVGPSSLLESHGSVLEELLLPAIEHRRLGRIMSPHQSEIPTQKKLSGPGPAPKLISSVSTMVPHTWNQNKREPS